MISSGCSCDECGEALCFGAVICDQCSSPCDPDKTRGFSVERKINRGDTIEIEWVLLDTNGSPIDLGATGVKVWFTANPVIPHLSTDAVLFQGTLANGAIAVVDLPTSGKIRLTIPASATYFMADGIEKLYYDLQVLDGDGRVTTVEKGRFFVSPDITRATS